MTRPDSPGFARPPRGDGRWLAGVAAGLAARWELSPMLARGAFIVATLAYGAGAVLYATLALAMPALGASAQRVARSTEAGRTLVVALRVAGAGAALAVVLVAAAALALFGLGVVALLLACACVIAIVVRPGLRPAPLGAAAVALTLPAAAVALGDAEIAPTIGDQVIELRAPSDVDASGYRAGVGPMLVDLRGFSADRGTTTTIKARADMGRLVVALPRNRCFNLVVDQTLDRRWPADLFDHRRRAEERLGSPIRFPLPNESKLQRAGLPTSLVAYGRPIQGRSVRLEQPTGSASAPTLHLVLTTGRYQAIVRDYPQTGHPLENPWWPKPRVLGAPRFGIPKGVAAQDSVPNDPLVPRLLNEVARLEARPGASSLGQTDQITMVMRGVWHGLDTTRRKRLLAFVRQELLLRAATREPAEMRQRLLGNCMTRAAERRTLSPVSIPEAQKATSKLSIRWSVIWDRWAGDPYLRPFAAYDRTASIDPIEIATAPPEVRR